MPVRFAPLVALLFAAASVPRTLRAQAIADSLAPIAPGVLSTPEHEYNPSLTPDGRMLVFARAEPTYRGARILVAQLGADDRWEMPRPLPFTDPRWRDSDPTFAPDGRTLYFISDRPAPGRDAARRDLDLWRVRRTPDGWGTPEHLGPDVNGPGEELGPQWRDGVLYFASTRAGGRGGLDLYEAPEADGRFAAPVPFAGGALNTTASEGDLELSPDGTVALFWSDRLGGAGTMDLWAARRTADGWSAPRPLAALNTRGLEFTPSFSPDGRWLWFASTRGVTTRPAAAELFRVPAAVATDRFGDPSVPGTGPAPGR